MIIYNIPVENMTSIIKSLHDLISQILACENRLQPYRMTEKQIK